MTHKLTPADEIRHAAEAVDLGMATAQVSIHGIRNPDGGRELLDVMRAKLGDDGEVNIHSSFAVVRWSAVSMHVARSVVGLPDPTPPPADVHGKTLAELGTLA